MAVADAVTEQLAAALTIALSSITTLDLLPAGVRDRAVVTGNPIRPELFTGQPERAVHTLKWSGHDPHLPTVYVTGGAQGSTQVNVLVDAVLEQMLGRADVVHQCGPISLPALQQRAEQLPAQVAGARSQAGVVEDIHSHAWDFCSRVLTGALRFTTYHHTGGVVLKTAAS